MRVKVAIANYESYQLKFLHQVVAGFLANKLHTFDIKVHTTVPVDYPHVLYPASVRDNLPYPSRAEMAAALDQYDLFIYTENDHLITQDNIEAFLEHSRTLRDGEVSGFIQYEVNREGRRILIVNPYWAKLTQHRTGTSFQLENRHQGCWILLRKDLEKAIRSGGFLVSLHHGPYGGLEQAASDPYTQCKLTKVFPLDYALCERLLIHHLPNKYVDRSQWVSHGVDLRTLFDRHL